MALIRHIVLLLLLLVSSNVIAADEAPRTITLKEIIYKSPTDWEIHLNDQKITPNSTRPLQILDLQVSADTVRVKWFDEKLNGVVDAKLAPFQTYDVESRAVERVRVPPPSGMTEEEWKWVEKAITTSMTFSHDHYQSELQSASENFTPKGWDQFMQSVLTNQLLENKEKFSITAFLKSPPSLIHAGDREDNKTWLFKVTLYINYSVKPEIRVMRSNFRILIERSTDKPSGLAISGWENIPPLQ